MSIILEYWKNHQQYWFAIKDTDKYIADNEIYNLFEKFDKLDNETVIGKIIYYDQFSRHFRRINNKKYSDEIVLGLTKLAYELFITNIDYFACSNDSIEIVFGLMPFKHLKKYDEIFTFIHETWKYKPQYIKNDSLIHRFYTDTYTKAYIKEIQKPEILDDKKDENETMIDRYKHILEYLPTEEINIDEINTDKLEPLIKNCLDNYIQNFRTSFFIVSLSGGVDSMVLLTCLKIMKVNNLAAVHIVYGNRKESEDEANFLIYYCKKIRIPLYIYRIPWIRRDQVEREYYENTTKDLRFSIYEWISKQNNNSHILLGHIEDDLVENVWQNISKCSYIYNLKKMTSEQIIKGPNGSSISLHRPFLSINKDTIYLCSKKLSIPYFLNTTPDWSQRGKFRNHFYKQAIDQFGCGVHTRILEFADIIQSESNIIQKLLIQPIINSLEQLHTDKNNIWKFNIQKALDGEIDDKCWIQVLEKMFNAVGLSRPSLKSIDQFYQQKNKKQKFKWQVKKEVLVEVDNNVMYIIKSN